MVGTEWAVRRRKLRPSAWWPRQVDRWSAPLLRPFEKRLTRAGANPVDAPLWLLGAALIGGLLLVGLAHWIMRSVGLLISMQSAPPLVWIRVVLSAILSLLMGAILVRVIGTWLGAGRFNRWIRPTYLLTDWIIEPIARRLPSRGLVDFSPFVAYLALLVLRLLIEGLLP